MRWVVELESRATGRKTITVSQAETEAEAKGRACKALGIALDDCSVIRAEQAGADIAEGRERTDVDVNVNPASENTAGPPLKGGPDEALDA